MVGGRRLPYYEGLRNVHFRSVETDSRVKGVISIFLGTDSSLNILVFTFRI